jgi:hypothetical protein
LAHALASPCLGHEPKVRVAIGTLVAILIVSMGIIIKKLIANVSHNEWWKCGHMA